ncbi:hypothetical protein PTSG_11224 [Salpingoeca rosetta]|uniref:Uncharacterized protein n=1 Tax=Salpingoeca rosetta (strain ATCC 50818 / BSB-021) TaxID=946362 RepID=F2USS8_SALR5|nr:uncharacterized protein PTSG_11224 [Salpingoeca rosetta]EGD81187.1 hypothetical protein PTSG_11224 [Salpingoeca rosetta]|eukprot:XP_004987722.1 hypothetical protein PTSG_11224 [Salpingoeca rosetta]
MDPITIGILYSGYKLIKKCRQIDQLGKLAEEAKTLRDSIKNAPRTRAKLDTLIHNAELRKQKQQNGLVLQVTLSVCGADLLEDFADAFEILLDELDEADGDCGAMDGYDEEQDEKEKDEEQKERKELRKRLKELEERYRKIAGRQRKQSQKKQKKLKQ